ncbi:MAG: hypothetical protein ACJ8JD_10820 [Chthoniobacterales bacterium]
MRKLLLPALFVIASFAVCRAEGLVKSTSHFYYHDQSGGISSAAVVHRYWSGPIVHPFAKIDSRIDMKLIRAATLAEERASAESRAHCWQSVKEALLASGVIDRYPTSSYACQAGDELVRDFGFHKLAGISDPYDAPIGAVLVYGVGSNGAGHVELRTKDGFVSDYHSKNRCKYPLIAAYAKLD